MGNVIFPQEVHLCFLYIHCLFKPSFNHQGKNTPWFPRQVPQGIVTGRVPLYICQRETFYYLKDAILIQGLKYRWTAIQITWDLAERQKGGKLPRDSTGRRLIYLIQINMTKNIHIPSFNKFMLDRRNWTEVLSC